MIQKVKSILGKIAEIEDIPIGDEDYVPINAFNDIQDEKRNIVKRSKSALQDILENQDKPSILICSPPVVNFIDECIRYIEKLVRQSPKTWPTQNVQQVVLQVIEELSNRGVRLVETLHPLEQELRIIKLEDKLKESAILKKIEAQAKKSFESISQQEKEFSKINENVKNQEMQKGLDISATHFETLKKNHSTMSFCWFISFIFFSVLTAGVLYYVIAYWKFGTSEDIDTVFSIFKRILIISAPSVFLKISLSKYQLERNLRIIYDHRATVLKIYTTFENAIGDDVPAKNEFRLTIAKYVFTDPQTGYIAQSKNNELAINPIVNMFEKAANKVTAS